MCPARIKLDRCDILTVKADACICGIHRSKNMKTFDLSRHVLRTCGESVQNELHKASSGELKLGQVEMTGPGQLKHVQTLMFICLRSYQEGHEQYLHQSLQECFELAATQGHASIAVPALGTGGLKYPPDKVARATVDAVALHNLQYGDDSPLKEVNIVLLDEDAELIMTYLRVCVSGSTNLEEHEEDKREECVGAVGGVQEQPSEMQGDSFTPLSKARQSDSSVKSKTTPPSSKGATNGSKTTPPSSKGATNGSKTTPPSSKGKTTGLVVPGLSGLIRSIFSKAFSYDYGVFKFTVYPSLDPSHVGVGFSVGVNISFLKSFIPPSLNDFFKSLRN